MAMSAGDHVPQKQPICKEKKTRLFTGEALYSTAKTTFQ
jgi:hypothetical protein